MRLLDMHSGMGYAKEFHIERYFREAMIPRIAPVSSQMILCFIAEKVSLFYCGESVGVAEVLLKTRSCVNEGIIPRTFATRATSISA
jgi:hypothetical protein